MKKIFALYSLFAICAGTAFTQEFGTNEDQLADVYTKEYTGKTYSPYAKRILSCRLMISSLTMGHGTSEIWIFPRQRPTLCLQANTRVKR